MQFDSLAAGDWDNNLIVDGVQITNNATARLWSVPDAFPNLKTPNGNTKVWGPCKYLDLAHPQQIDLWNHEIILDTADS